MLVSIQGLVLVSEPYYNEAGYEKQMGTLEGRHNSKQVPGALRACMPCVRICVLHMCVMCVWHVCVIVHACVCHVCEPCACFVCMPRVCRRALRSWHAG